MRVLFMGTPEFAVPTLENLIKNHTVIGVVTQPDRPKGRGKKMMFTPVKEVALRHEIPVYQPNKIKDSEFISKLKSIDADIYIVVAYGQILSEEILSIPKLGCVNVHGSLLPKYRGAGPIQWAIINGENITGVTIMYMEKGLDSGDMILKNEITIDKNDTYGSLHDKMSIVGANALISAIELIEKGLDNPTKQDNFKATYAPMLSKDFGNIDWSKNSDEIINFIRGLNPWPSAFTFYKGEIFKIWNAEEVSGYTGKVGEVLDILPKKGFVVKTGNSALHITEIQIKGGKKMCTADYLRGHNIEIGYIFNKE